MANEPARFSSFLENADRVLSSNRRWLPFLLIGAFVVKLPYILQSAGATHVTVPIMDSEYYYRMAEDILAGRLIRNEAFFMGPLYPYVLALIFSVFGKSIMAVRIVQAVVGSITIMLTYVLGREVMRPSVALLAACLLAFYGALTFYEGQLLMMWLGTFLNVSMLLMLVRSRGRTRAYVMAGVLLGLSALARANVVVLLVVIVPWILFVSGDSRRLRHLAVMLAVTIVTILPATIHNLIASHDFVPITSNAGINFYIGNSEDATGIFYPPKGINLVTDNSVEKYVERALGKDVSPSEQSRYWFRESFTFIKNNPGRAIALFLRKTALYFNGYEVPQIESYDIARSRYGSLRFLFVNMWGLLCVGLLGMIYATRQWRRYFLLYGYVLAFSLSIIAFFVTSRYRVQIAPVLALFAAHALLVTIPAAIANLRRQLLPVVVIAVLLMATNPKLFALPADQIVWREHTHEARRLSKIGRHEEALAEINKAVDIHPDQPDSYVNRALIEKAAGKRFEAVQDYARALDIDPNSYTVQYDFGQLLRDLRMYDPAIEAYRKAIELNPLMLEAHNNLGITYRQQRRYEEANEQFQEVIDRDPRYIKAYNNLGASLAESGQLDRAIDVLVRGINVDPRYANTYKNLGMAYIQKKDVAQARDMFQQYLKLEPNDANIQEILDQLQAVMDADTLGEG